MSLTSVVLSSAVCVCVCLSLFSPLPPSLPLYSGSSLLDHWTPRTYPSLGYCGLMQICFLSKVQQHTHVYILLHAQNSECWVHNKAGCGLVFFFYAALANACFLHLCILRVLCFSCTTDLHHLRETSWEWSSPVCGSSISTGCRCWARAGLLPSRGM